MTTDIIRYDLLVQDALRGVVRKVLSESAREGMPGDHHYYITFRTDAPGVRLSSRMREKYPGEMTIILQHQFWDLSVTEQNFEVGLSFNNIPESLLIPFDAVTGFFDPSVQFGLKFEVTESGPEVGANDIEPSAAKPTPAKTPRAAKGGDKRASDNLIAGPKAAAPVKAGKAAAQPAAGIAPPVQPESTPNVVSIDAFRKKP